MLQCIAKLLQYILQYINHFAAIYCRNFLVQYVIYCNIRQYIAIQYIASYAHFTQTEDCFGSAARAERLFSHCKYIKTETRNRLITKNFEHIIFLKSNRELWKNSQQLITRAISMSKMKKKLAHIKEWKKMKPKKRE